jgi:hypothetical protein
MFLFDMFCLKPPLKKILHCLLGSFINLPQGPSIRKKNDDFVFDNFGTHNKKIHTIYKQTSVFVLVHIVVLVLLAKQQQQKIVNLHTISVYYAWALTYRRSLMPYKDF